MRLITTCLVISLLVTISSQAHAQGSIGLRLGVGTDFTFGGLAGGAELNVTIPTKSNAIELGILGFGGNFKETTEEGCCTYNETTKIFVFGGLANYLLAYANPHGPYFVIGVGAGMINVNWREESPDDTSLGPPLPGGGSFQEEDGTTGGIILNAGLGYRLSERVDLRFQVPTFFVPSQVAEGASTAIPTLTFGVGFRF